MDGERNENRKENPRRPKERSLINKTAGCMKRKAQRIRDIELNFQIMNCQSLKMKLGSLADNFIMNKCAFILTNETWFKKGDKQLKSMLTRLEDEHSISCIRKDRKLKNGLAHGGVAVFYDTDRCSFKKLNLNALRGDARDFEILPVRGNLKGVQRELVIFSCYLPPKINKTGMDRLLESLTDAISEAKAKVDNPWVVVAGDWNRYKTDLISTMFPDLTVYPTDPTRGTATLDYSFTNFNDLTTRAEVSFPVQSNHSKSDHGIVNYT